MSYYLLMAALANEGETPVEPVEPPAEEAPAEDATAVHEKRTTRK